MTSSMATEYDPRISDFPKTSIAAAAFAMCVFAAIFYCYEYYLRVVPSVIQPQLMETFSLSQSGLGTLIAYYYFAYVPLQIPVGLIMDYWGPRRVLTFACFMCALGTYLFASTHSVMMAKVGRFMVGFGSAFAYIGVLKIANLWLPHRYFAMMAGLCTALGMFGAMSGGVLMTRLVDVVGWREALYAASVLGVILTIAIWFVVRDKSEEEMIEIGRASYQKEGSLWTQLLEIVQTKQLWINGVIGCLTFLPLTAFAEFWAVSYLELAGFNKEVAALGSAVVFLGYGLGAPMWGRISDLICSRRMPMMIGAILSASMAVILFNYSFVSVISLYTVLFFMGFFASAQVLVFAVGEDICRPEMSATTVAFTNFVVMMGGFALQPLVGIMLDSMQLFSVGGVPYLDLAIFKTALLILPLGLILAAVLCFFLKETYRSS